MARPQKNNLDYFPHDNSMRNDRKIKALRAKFEHKGYAIYNMLLEILCEADLLILKWDETEIELVSGDLNIVSDELTQVSEYLFHIKLLKQVNGYVFCPQLDKRSESVFGKRTKDLNSLRIENGINVTETKVSESKTPQTLPETPQSKVKESKVKNIYSDFLKRFNEITDKKIRIIDDKTKRQLNARIKEGFTIKEIYQAIENCKNDKFHIENPKYLTPEFITRTDKLQKYLNYSNETNQRSHTQRTFEQRAKNVN